MTSSRHRMPSSSILFIFGLCAFATLPCFLSPTLVSAQSLLTPTLYVSTTGCDACSGYDGKSVTKAFATIAKAASVATAGAIIQVQNGTYNVNSGAKGGSAITTSCSGTSTSPITFQAQSRGGAKFVDTGLGIIWQHKGNYGVFDGFEMTGTARLGFFFTGSYNEVRYNYIHDLIAQGGAGGSGGAAIDGIGNNMEVHHNRVLNIDVAQFTGSTFVQGIYIAGADWYVHHNIVSGVACAGIQQWHGATTSKITYNTVFASKVGILLGQGDAGADYVHGTHDNLVQYNVVYGNSNGIYGACSGGACIGANNVWTNNCLWLNTQQVSSAASFQMPNTVLTTSPNTIANPLFVNYKADGTGDYRLTSGSPCAGLGAGDISPRTSGSSSSSSTGSVVSSSTGSSGPSSPPATLPTPTLYVSTTGCDTCTGYDGKSVAKAFKTVAKAASVAVAGDVIQVQNGTYNVNSGAKGGSAITTSCSGTATKPIIFQAQSRWGVKFVDTGLGIIWQHKGQFTVLNGFEMTGTARIGFYLPGSNNEVKYNFVHDLTCKGGTGGSGGAAIDGIGQNMLVHHNIVRNIDIAHFTGTSTVQGIYIAGAGWNVHHNIISGVAADGISNWHGATTATIQYNTVFNSGSGTLIGQGDSGAVIPPGTHDNLVQYNVYYNNRQGLAEYCYSGVKCTGTNNRYLQNCMYLNTNNYNPNKLSTGITYSGNVIADPKFNNYKADGTGDYTLKSGSPCAGWGAGAGALALSYNQPSEGAVDSSSFIESPFDANATADTSVTDAASDAAVTEGDNRPEDATPAPISADPVDQSTDSSSDSSSDAQGLRSFTFMTLAAMVATVILA